MGTSTTSSPPDRRPRWADVAARPDADAGRRAGSVAAAICNAVLLWVSHQLLDWQWPRFLTPEFQDVLPIVSASFVATIVANLLFVAYDARWFTSLLNAVTSAISLTAGIRLLQVFPFDFSTYATDWSWLVRLVLVVGVIGTAVAVVVYTVRLLEEAIRAGHPAPRDGSAPPT
jgi:hypothetical protein